MVPACLSAILLGHLGVSCESTTDRPVPLGHMGLSHLFPQRLVAQRDKILSSMTRLLDVGPSLFSNQNLGWGERRAKKKDAQISRSLSTSKLSKEKLSANNSLL